MDVLIEHSKFCISIAFKPSKTLEHSKPFQSDLGTAKHPMKKPHQMIPQNGLKEPILLKSWKLQQILIFQRRGGFNSLQDRY